MNADNRLNEDGLIISAHYAETMNGLVLPALAEKVVETTVAGDGGRPLSCVQYAADHPRGTVLVLHGFTENAYKFSELIYSLLANDFSVVAYDQRGHGNSWRKEGLSDLSLTHVDDFNEYEKDLTIVCAQLLSGMPKPHYIFAHSMGGAVASLFLERHQGVFEKTVLCAPMIAPNRSGIPLGLGKLICETACLMGKRTKRSFVSKPYSGHENFDTSCASGRERFEWYDDVRFTHPEYQNASPSYGWTLEALNVTEKLLKPGEVEKIDCPVRIYTAENDWEVLPEAQEAFIRRVKDGKRTLVKGSKHEIYRSGDDVLFPWWHEILTFYKQ